MTRPQPLNMFAAGEDLPLFTGQAPTFTPKPPKPEPSPWVQCNLPDDYLPTEPQDPQAVVIDILRELDARKGPYRDPRMSARIVAGIRDRVEAMDNAAAIAALIEKRLIHFLYSEGYRVELKPSLAIIKGHRVHSFPSTTPADRPWHLMRFVVE